MIKLLQISHLLLSCLWLSIIACSDHSAHKTEIGEHTPSNEDSKDPEFNTFNSKKSEDEPTLNPDPENPPEEPINPPLPPPEEPINPPEEPPQKTPPGLGLSRKDPPPRAQFVKEDHDEIWKLNNRNAEEAYKRIAEIYQFDGFRSVTLNFSAPQLTKQAPRVLLLTPDADHMVWTINFLAGVARDINHNVSIVRQKKVIALEDREWSTFRYLKIASLSEDRSEVLMQEDLTEYASFLKFSKEPLNEKVKEFWPEARYLEIDFGKGARVALIYSSVNSGFIGSDYKSLNGEVLFQTPWILRALEGEPLQAIWHSTTSANAEHYSGYQFEPNEKKRRAHNRHTLFEEIWDERSLFFPKREHAFRFREDFVSNSFCEGMHLFGINELQPAKISDLRNAIADLSRIPSFTFKNTIP